MRTLHLLPFLLLAIALSPQAEAQAQFGLRAGLNTSDFAGDGAPNSQAQLGFHGGVTAMFGAGSGLYVQPEVLYSQKGAGVDGQNSSVRLDYIDVPVLLGFSFPTASNLIVRAYAGPQVSFKVAESSTGGVFTADTDFARAVDYGAAFGGDVGARRVGTTSTFGVGVRYSLGLADVRPEGSLSGLFGGSDIRNRVLSVSAFYTF